MNHDLISYYSKRAKEYDKVYAIPEEQEDLIKATKIFQELLAGKTVFEIACGTGYWTEQISKRAAHILATDINESVIEVAKGRNFTGDVSFSVADMYAFSPETKYDALFGGFIWSHIPLQDLNRFLKKTSNFVTHNGIIVFIDSKPVARTIHDKRKIAKTDENGNTYQSRTLEDGTTHLVLKNFPTKEFLVERLSKFSMEIQYTELEHYWIVICKLM